MKIISKLAAEFQIKFIVESFGPLEDFSRLLFQVKSIVKTDVFHLFLRSIKLKLAT